jgi:hypothetical protein
MLFMLIIDMRQYTPRGLCDALALAVNEPV